MNRVRSGFRVLSTFGLLSWVLPCPVFAQDPSFTSPPALTAKSRHDRAIQEAATRYIQDLRAALQSATRTANLSEVAAIQAEIDRLSPPVSLAPAPLLQTRGARATQTTPRVLVYSENADHLRRIAPTRDRSYSFRHSTRIPTSDVLAQYSVLIFMGGGYRNNPDPQDDEIERIVAFVESGGGLLGVGLAWPWASQSYGNKPIETYPLNRLGVPFGFRLGRGAGRPAANSQDEEVFGRVRTWEGSWVPSQIDCLVDTIQPSLQDERGRSVAVKGVRGSGRIVILGHDLGAFLSSDPEGLPSILDYLTKN